jgi:hypothetical protein
MPVTTRLPPGEIALLLDRVKREGGLPDVAETLGEQFDALGATTPLIDILRESLTTNAAVVAALEAQATVASRGVAALEREAAASEVANRLEERKLRLRESAQATLWKPVVGGVVSLLVAAASYYAGVTQTQPPSTHPVVVPSTP